MEIHEDHNKFIRALYIKKDELESPKHEDLIISYPIVMASNAGWYVGRVCIEYITYEKESEYSDSYSEWCQQPYCRDTEYMTKEEAMEWWITFYKEDMETEKDSETIH